MEYYVFSPILFVLRILEVFSQFFIIIVISKYNIKIKNFFVAPLIMAIIFEIIKLITPQYLVAVVSLCLGIVVLVIILKLNYKKAIVSYFIASIFTAIIDCIVCTSMLKILSLTSFEDITNSVLLTSIAKIFVISITLLIAFLLKKYRNKFDLSKLTNIKNKTEIVTLVFTFLLLIPNLVMILYYHDQKPLPLYIIGINIVAIIAMFFINIINTRRSIKLVQAEEELITEKIHNKTQAQLVDSLRTFKHDLGNMLQIMNGYIYMKDMDGLTEYFNQVLADSKIITALDSLNPELFDNPSLFGLITAKFEYARKNNVNMNFEIYTKLDTLDIKSYDFTRVFGIFLDNAIEASIGSQKKIVNIYATERNNIVTLEISNSFSDTELKVEEIYKKGISSKGDNRGLGLFKVKDILSKYPKIKHETKVNNDIFLQRLVINKIQVKAGA